MRTLAIFISPLCTLAVTTSVYAEVPVAARIVEVKGLSELGVRRGSRYNPADRRTVLKRHEDTLIVPSSGRSTAGLRFFARFDKDLGLFVRAVTRNKLQTLYYFPCTFLGNEFIMEWANIGRKRGCDRGIRVQRWGKRGSKGLDAKDSIASFEKQSSGSNPRSQFRYHCVVLNKAGQGWLSVEESKNPCREPLEQCFEKTSGGDCTIATLDRWQTREPEVALILACASDRIFETKGMGSKLDEQIHQLWNQAKAQGATWCGLHTLGSEDVLIIPKNERVLVRTRDTGTATSVEIIAGSATVRTANNPKGDVVVTGQRYIYTNAEAPATVGQFDANQEIKSPEIQDFIVAAQPPQIPVGNPADAEYVVANLANGSYTFCTGPQPPPDDWRRAVGVCYWFDKIGDRAVGTYGYPYTDDLVSCVEGKVTGNTVFGNALDVSWSGRPWIRIPQSEFLWDNEGRLTLGSGKIIKTSGSGRDRNDFIEFRTTRLNLSGFYLYKEDDKTSSTKYRMQGCTIEEVEKWLRSG